MQCAACRAVYSSGLECCPRCHRPASSSPAPAIERRATAAEDTNGSTAAPRREAHMSSASDASSEPPARGAAADHTPHTVSTLIEFPGTGRSARPQWRKDLSERVREIQARRAREAALEAEAPAPRPTTEPSFADDTDTLADQPLIAEQNGPQLGLVPHAEAPAMNPLVAAALRRIERARQQPPPPMSRAPRGAAAAAVARAVEEQYEISPETEMLSTPAIAHVDRQATPSLDALASSETTKREKTVEGARATGLVVVSTPPNIKHETPAAAVARSEASKTSATAAERRPLTTAATAVKPNSAADSSSTGTVISTESKRALPPEAAGDGQSGVTIKSHESTPQPPRRLTTGVIDDSWLTRLEAEILPPVVSARDNFDDRAPLSARFVGAIADLFLIAFLSSPFAAVIELTSGNWSDPRVAASMGGIFVVVMFLYLTGSTALAGRTIGMKLFALHTVDAATALAPTTAQSVRRTLVYILSLVTFGIGILYALFDAEGRAAHDHLSGTIIVRE